MLLTPPNQKEAVSMSVSDPATRMPLLPSPPDRPVAKARLIGRLIDRLLTSLIVALGVMAVGIGILTQGFRRQKELHAA